MFFDPDRGDHGLPFNPFKACVVPRPIGWITTLKRNGKVNLAPFSQFNLVGFDPGYLVFSANTHPPDHAPKHSIENAEREGEFVYNMATWAARQDVVASSFLMDSESDDLEALGLASAPGRNVRTPRLAQAPVAIECRHHTTLLLPGLTPDTTHRLVVGRVVGVHIDDGALTAQGRLDVARLKPLARLGYADYACVENVFTIEPREGALSADTMRKMQGGR
ncbi:flavin reductase family protein [Ramlibacter sp.]|uniref:flavin reductase family protein n=1 Tax=Ramlibacter sp. TaxID=1917967 RepID=UPI003D0A2C01